MVRVAARRLTVASYLFSSKHALQFPTRPATAPEQIADWLEATLRAQSYEVERLDERTIRLRKTIKPLDWFRRRSIAGVGAVELDVEPAWDGFRITVHANPRVWVSLIPMIPAVILFAWPNLGALLQWSAGFGGILAGGFILFVVWGRLTSVVESLLGRVRAQHAPPVALGPRADRKV